MGSVGGRGSGGRRVLVDHNRFAGQLDELDGAKLVRLHDDLGTKDVEAHLPDPHLEWALTQGALPVRFLPRVEVLERWPELRSDFFDTPGWTPPPDAPGTRPMRGELWTTGQRTIVLLTDHD